MRTRKLCRNFPVGVRNWHLGYLGYAKCAVAATLLSGLALAAANGQTRNGAADGPRSDTPSALSTEPVAVESRRPAVAPVPANSRSVDIRVDKTLVLINVTVTDPLNRFVTGLEKDHFRLFEDKVEQQILQFSAEDAPISIGLVFDTSGSMGPKLQKSR